MVLAADMEDKTEKHPVTPGEIIPARELLGNLYMELNNPVKALEAYEQNLAKCPGRFNGLYGAALSSKRSGNAQKSKQYFNLLVSTTNPESARIELKGARQF